MLDKTDLDQIQAMISESEARLLGTMDAKFAESEARLLGTMDAKFAESEARTDAKLSEMKSDIMQSVNVLMESKFDPKFNLLAEMVQSVLDRLPDPQKIEDLEDRIEVLEATARNHSREIAALKSAN